MIAPEEPKQQPVLSPKSINMEEIMKKQVGKKLVLNKSTVANLENRVMAGVKGGTGLSTLPASCLCLDHFTDSDPPTKEPCPTLQYTTSDPDTTNTNPDPGNVI
jgi:hypothetical protein